MTPIIQVDHIKFEVDNQIILKDLSFSIKKGERVTLTGPSGGGKSTLLKIIASIIDPSSGEVLFKNKVISEMDPINYRRKVSYFFQNAALFDETVQDNLAFPFEIRDEDFDRERSIRMLERVKLSENYLNKQIKELSGGEKQRISLVRNLLYKPEVLLLDEITSSLDAENKEIVYAILDELNTEEDMTLLFVTHDEREIKQADRVLRIRDGLLEETK